MTGNKDFCLFFGVNWHRHYDAVKMGSLIENCDKQNPLKVSE